MRDALANINSATKYPSIETYHKLGERGRLTDEVQVTFEDDLIGTEKIDGTNARIILFPPIAFLGLTPAYIIGSREDLLHGQGDLIFNPAQGIVEAIRGLANRAMRARLPDHVFVFYGEVYGGKVTKASKFYSTFGSVGFRLFDALEFQPKDFDFVIRQTRAQIASWRDAGNQPFVSEDRLQDFSEILDVPLTPRVEVSRPLPTSVEETHAWLMEVMAEGSQAVLDQQGKGGPEGVVVRSHDRSRIAKIRFEDYERTARQRPG